MPTITGFTKVSVANMALAAIGARSRISSFDENSAEAEQIRLWYEITRAQVLQSYDWPFARKRKALTLATSDPPDEWAFRYNRSTDMLQLRSIWNPMGKGPDAIPYDLEQDSDDSGNMTILTNQEDAIAIYTAYDETVQLYNPLFAEAVSLALAMKICLPLTGNTTLQQTVEGRYKATMRFAHATAVSESVEPPPRDAEWIRNR